MALGLSFTALPFAPTVAAIPYIVLAIYRGLPAQLKEGASILGACRWQTLRHATLPLVRPGIFAGLFAVLTSLDNLPLSYFFGSATTNTLPVVMLSSMENQFDPSIAALLVLDRIYGIERLTAV
jgi:putative spermidine/putrescine transport system permease protein